MFKPAASMVARRMTAASSATAHEHSPVTSIARRRDTAPSSPPTRTIRPNGPATNDSAGRSIVRTVLWPSRPRETRWRCNSPVRSTIGSRRYHGCWARSDGDAGARAATLAVSPDIPLLHGGGAHDCWPAPSVAVATDPTATRAISPGPTQPTHRDSITVHLLRRDSGGGRRASADTPRGHRSGPYPGVAPG